MKQVLQNIKTGETQVVDVPVPTLKPGMVLVRTTASLVSSGTERMVVDFAEKSLIGKAQARPDLVRQVIDKAKREGVLTTFEAAMNKLDQPLPLGYSSAGVVVGVGDGVSHFRVGQRVACAGGGYAVHAEYVLVPTNLVVPIPDNIDDESAAFTTIGAVALHGFRMASPQIGENVAIIGLGLLGMLAAGIAKAAGLNVLGVDLSEDRVQFAKSLGIQSVLRGQAVEAGAEFTRNRGFDHILICADTSSNDPIVLAGDIARDRANVVAIGAIDLEIPRKVYYEKELSFVNSRSYGPGRYDKNYEEKGHDYPIGYVRWTEGRNLEAFLDILASGRFDVKRLITHRFAIDDATKAYDLITGKVDERFLGVLLTYPRRASSEEKISSGKRLDYLPPSTRTHGNAIKLGVIGAGNFAQAVMLPAIKDIPNIDFVEIISAFGVNAQHVAKKYKFRSVSTDFDEVVTHSEVDTIAILTQHHLHAEQVIAGLRNGKHVFCEKPLAINLQQLEEVEKVLIGESQSGEKTAPLLTVGFNRRFAPMVRKMKAFLDEGSEPIMISYRVNAGYIPLSHWIHDPEIGGGRIIGEACHFIDLMTYLVNSPPNEVYCAGLPDFGKYSEDNVSVSMRFPDGSVGNLMYVANGDKSFPKEYIEVYRGGRIAILNDFRTLQLIYDGRKKTIKSRLSQDKGHRQIWVEFVNAILKGSEPPIPYEHLFGVTKASFAALKSLRDHKPVLLS